MERKKRASNWAEIQRRRELWTRYRIAVELRTELEEKRLSGQTVTMELWYETGVRDALAWVLGTRDESPNEFKEHPL